MTFLISKFQAMFKVDGLKHRGNESFKNGDYEEALQFYSEAIELEKASSIPSSTTLAILYSNSAQVYLASHR
jgi:tetratricopeptide (TPR) repeat protein